ncbi:unnamed protein product [Vitrella brassicaformis CCMP3155]|uniref:Uncharacterized protein n=1 Tax=Vitrella brassicaformis (strain CCMP3155) TaxID=1169540 RepID=A0A0G4GK82_VITBC|nr:unnamed protein product [Vitrella brassicaformis CCMP3155]|eukprot:CEM30307.1 unnamed protein product [Vitrella brassicaformis CCMP3155]
MAQLTFRPVINKASARLQRSEPIHERLYGLASKGPKEAPVNKEETYSPRINKNSARLSRGSVHERLYSLHSHRLSEKARKYEEAGRCAFTPQGKGFGGSPRVFAESGNIWLELYGLRQYQADKWAQLWGPVWGNGGPHRPCGGALFSD